MVLVAVVPLARNFGHDGEFPCRMGQDRCKKAVERVQEAEDRFVVEKVVLALGAGRPARLGEGYSLAECSENYISTLRAKCDLVVNRDDRTPVTSLSEMRWVVDEVYRQYGSTYEEIEFWFVTSKRHDIRIRLISKLFFPGLRSKVYTSSGPAVPLVGEFLGYAKLAAIWLFGKSWVERVRYHTSRPSFD